MTAASRYIFCDIDGTLLYAKGSGRPAFSDAFLGAYGVPVDMSHINFAGATDLRVLEQLVAETESDLAELKRKMSQMYQSIQGRARLTSN